MLRRPIDRAPDAKPADVRGRQGEKHRRPVLHAEKAGRRILDRVVERVADGGPERAEAEVEDQPERDLDVDEGDEEARHAFVARGPRAPTTQSSAREGHDGADENHPAPVTVNQSEDPIGVGHGFAFHVCAVGPR